MALPDPGRRGLLRGLATLPLIGGGVTLLGSPTGAAVPVTADLLNAYDAWLDLERSFLKWERYGPDGRYRRDATHLEVVFRDRRSGEVFDMRHAGPGAGFHSGSSDTTPPSTRAAIVLSAVGCGWRTEPPHAG